MARNLFFLQFFPEAIGEGIDIRLDDLGADAFYWDEYNQSRGAYTYAPGMWDGCPTAAPRCGR